MIKVEFKKGEYGKSLVMKVKGHAGMGTKGNDIVCAAASAYACLLAQTVDDAYHDKRLAKKPVLKLDEGDTTVTAKPTKGAYHGMEYAYRLIARGFELLQANYPECFSLSVFDE